MSAYSPDISDVVPASLRRRLEFTYGEAFVQGAWRRVIDGIPEGYVPVPYPKFQQNRRTGETCVVATEAAHRELFASDPDWELAPGSSDLLERFFKELS